MLICGRFFGMILTDGASTLANKSRFDDTNPDEEEEGNNSMFDFQDVAEPSEALGAAGPDHDHDMEDVAWDRCIRLS